jgi:hypothetical protein
MTNQINPVDHCDQFNEALADLLERELPEPMRAAMEAHAIACNDCGPLLADLRKLRLDAANLPELAPGRDLWAGIEARIETPVVAIGARGAERGSRVRRSWIASGLAAAALVGITASTTYLLTKHSNDVAATAKPSATVATLTTPPRVDSTAAPKNQATSGPAGSQASAPASQRTAKPQAPVLALASNKLSPEATYDLEINRLHKIVDRRRADLDSSTVAVLEKNLAIIDNAIAQCRLALKKDPASSYLNESLNDALDNKVQLLRTAAGLPSKM